MAPQRQSTRPIFRDCVIASTGDLDSPRWQKADVARWVTSWGGRFTADFDDSVTHLLATTRQFKDDNPLVKAARKRKHVYIVTKDWLEDSIDRKRRLREKEYCLRQAWTAKCARLKKRSRDTGRGLRDAENFVNTDLNHIYMDRTCFRYEVTLTRDYEETGNIGQKYVLYLFESNAAPHLYEFAARFWGRPRAPAAIHRPRTTGRVFDDALCDFARFFRAKTGIDWDDRLEGAVVAVGGGGGRGKGGADDSHYFVYKPPTGGKPLGLVRGSPASLLLTAPGDDGRGHVDGDCASAAAAVRPDSSIIDDVVHNDNKHVRAQSQAGGRGEEPGSAAAGMRGDGGGGGGGARRGESLWPSTRCGAGEYLSSSPSAIITTVTAPPLSLSFCPMPTPPPATPGAAGGLPRAREEGVDEISTAAGNSCCPGVVDDDEEPVGRRSEEK